jgi:hypothetical protein
VQVWCYPFCQEVLEAQEAGLAISTDFTVLHRPIN